ncbi:MAG: GNAT family N-acetyltransferase [Planctomycetes bacterium]|nr:GNAT family N-acetyltransferase [Planctomycetota bacterium]
MTAMPAPGAPGDAVGGSARPTSTRPPITWTTRRADTSDMAGILACREVTFAGEDLDKADAAYWNWEFVDNHAGPARLFVAVDGERIVGHYAVIPQRFVLDQQVLPGSIVVDVMTHPDYRFQGMFTRLGGYSLAQCEGDGDFEFTTGYPIREAVIPGHLKVGWRIRFRIGTYVMPLAMAPLLRARLPWLGKVPGLASVLGALPGAALRLWGKLRLGRGDAGVRIERREQVDAARLATFWEQVRAAPPAGCMLQERSAEYLAWRFDANPNRHYLYHLACDEGGKVLGFVVSRPAPLLDVEAMTVVDACLLPGVGEAVLRRLLADVRARAVEIGCPMLAMMVTQPNPYFPNPSRLGFLATPYRFSFITRPLAPGGRSEDDSLRWHLMWGDTDDV